MTKHNLLVVWLLMHLLGLNMATTYGQDADMVSANVMDKERQYLKALSLHRQSKAEQALPILENLHRSYPNESRFLSDYVAIASEAGRHDLVLAAAPLDLRTAPAYALEALALSQRISKAYEAALMTYDSVASRFPERVDAQVARVEILIDALRFQEAEVHLLVLQKRHPKRRDVMECAVRLSDAVKQPINTLSGAQKILQLDPNDSFALRMRFYALKKLGAPHLAVQLTPKLILSETELVSIERDQLAFELRWARINADKLGRTSRWRELDAVINKLRAMCALADNAGSAIEAARGGCGDLVAALVDRRRTSEAITLYERMVEKKWLIQPHVQMAVAAAYLEERKPTMSRDIFAAFLRMEPDNSEAKIGYIYALLESGQYQDAGRYADQFAADTPEWLNQNFLAIREANPDYLQAQLISAQIRSYTNQLPEAERGLQSLAVRAPSNVEIRHALATNNNFRGWPRRAEQGLKWLHAAQPTNAWTKLGLYETHMALGDYSGAEQQLNDAAELMRDEKFIRKRQFAWETHNLRELVVDSSVGQSVDGGVAPSGNREALIDTYLYSNPLRYNWRVFMHAQYARSTYPGLAVSRIAEGGGVEYRARDVTATSKIIHTGTSGVGYSIGTNYQFNDHWHISGLAESNSLSTPLRAYADGVRARNYQIGGGYRWHESRHANWFVNQMSFSDNNRRRTSYISWMEGLSAGAKYSLSATLEYYATANSTPNAVINYFNPIRDQYVGVSFRNEWLQFQRYEKSLKHSLAIRVGTYAQKNFDSGSVINMQYEQAYTPYDRLELRYGLGTLVHPYDGVRVTEYNATLGVGWRF